MRRTALLAFIIAAWLQQGSGPALAAGWVFRPAQGGGSAGFVAGGDFSGLWLACSGSGARLFVSTGGTRLQAGTQYTAVVDVDGTAFLQKMTATGSAEGPALRRNLAPGEFRSLADALAKGRRSEVSMPAGRFALPLAGSGKALASLLAACR